MARNLLNADRRKERATQQMLRSRIANRHKGEIRKAIRQAMKAGATAFEADGQTATRSAINSKRDIISEKMEAMHRGAFKMLGSRVLDAALEKRGAGAGEFKVVSEDPEAAFDEILRAYIAEQSARKVEMVMGTTNSQLARIIAQGTREGAGTSEIARRIRSQSDQLAKVRSEVIARTETHSAGQRAQDEAAKASGAVREKEWISSLDDRTRDDRFNHRRPDGETVGINDAFVQTGESLQHPGDSVGSPGNIIMCRCGTGYVVD